MADRDNALGATASDVDSFLACSVEDSSDDEEAAHDSPFEFSESKETPYQSQLL